MKLYSGSVCCLVEHVRHCENIHWDFVWFAGTGRAM